MKSAFCPETINFKFSVLSAKDCTEAQEKYWILTKKGQFLSNQWTNAALGFPRCIPIILLAKSEKGRHWGMSKDLNGTAHLLDLRTQKTQQAAAVRNRRSRYTVEQHSWRMRQHWNLLQAWAAARWRLMQPSLKGLESMRLSSSFLLPRFQKPEGKIH